MKNDGGPAFPETGEVYGKDGDSRWAPGMSLRDWFAGMVAASTAGLMVVEDHYGYSEVADIAYSIADALIAERESSESSI